MTISPFCSSLPFIQQVVQKNARSFFSKERSLFALSLASFALLSLAYVIYHKSLKYRKLIQTPQSEKPSTTQTLFTQTISSYHTSPSISHSEFQPKSSTTLRAEQATHPLISPDALPLPTLDSNLITEEMNDPERVIPKTGIPVKLTLPEGISFEGTLLPIAVDNSCPSTPELSSSFQGSFSYPDGTVMSGLFEKGELNGEGSVYYGDSQAEVTGHFSNGSLVEGTAFYSSGEMIEGTFCSEKLNGFGKVTYQDGSIKKGQFTDGKLDGEGDIFTPLHQASIQSPYYIKGCFKTDELVSGEIMYADRTLSGTFKNHLLEGPGCTIVYGDHDIFMEGEFKAGILEGLGQITYKTGPRLEGFFKQGELNGPATITYADQRTVQGFFVNGKLNGIGRIEQMDGSIHEGIFKDDELQGLGRITQLDGTFFEGWFENSLLNGPGLIGSATGPFKKGLFTKGMLTKPEPVELPEIPTLNLSKLAEDYLSSDVANSPFIIDCMSYS